ncbi:MAG TPA: hypothetical protein PKW79_01930 [Rhabdochlamydiaceae bacterium]|nr:hypothetical protein [Rhabdochlamydiaceae bacterium]
MERKQTRSLDESPEFHDPYSDLNLFLSRKVKEEMKNGPKKWSLFAQEKLLSKIGPEFNQKFPRYRLGIAALKKIWEKVSYLYQTLADQKEAVNEAGQLNVNFLIRENLKQFLKSYKNFSFHPYLIAQQLALKISEYLATCDGIRPVLQHITKMIWAIERHMIPPVRVPGGANPYDEFDKWDRVIVKTMLEVSSKNPHFSQEKLQSGVREAICSFKDLPSISQDSMKASVSALLAQKLYSINPALKQVTICDSEAQPNPNDKDHSRKARPRRRDDLAKPQQAHCHLFEGRVNNVPTKQKWGLSFFLQNQLAIHRNWKGTYTELVLRLRALYVQACQKETDLPFLSLEDLEIVIWKTVADQSHLLEIFPSSVRERVETEIATIFIDNPRQKFRTAVDTTVQYFKNAKELAITTNWVEIEHKITLWTIQGDLIYRLLDIGISPLLTLLQSVPASSAADLYLRSHPFINQFADQLKTRIKILEKYLFYAVKSTPEQSTVSRFFQWHLNQGSSLESLEEICRKKLPLLPFDLRFAKEQITPQDHEGDAE